MVLPSGQRVNFLCIVSLYTEEATNYVSAALDAGLAGTPICRADAALRL
jgi:hypothetical protein